MWTKERPTKPGWYWVRWPHEPHIGAEIREVTQPNGPDTDYLEVEDVPMDDFVQNWVAVEWQKVVDPTE